MVRHDTTSIGRYTLHEDLGAGGFASVYRAHDPVLDREIALKVLHPHLARDAATRDRFVREGRALARIRHPNIVQVFDAGEAEGLVYLAMELVDGRSVAALLKERGPLGLRETAEIVDELAAALTAVHARGLVHCDVKPANVLIEDDGGRAVLLDLGVSRRVDDSASTSGGWLVGTPAFMAPEQVSPGRHVTAQTDVYQLGATVFAMLTGEPPFSGEPTQVMFAVVHHDPPDVTALQPGLPAGVATLIAAAMAKEPGDRPPGPLAFAARLREAAGLRPLARRGAKTEELSTEAVTQAIARPAPVPARTIEETAVVAAPARPVVTERVMPPHDAGPARATPPPRRRRSAPPALLGGGLALLALAAIGGAILARGRGDEPSAAAPAQPPAVAVLPFTVTPTPAPTPSPPASASPSAAPSPSTSPSPPASASPSSTARPAPPPPPAPAPAPPPPPPAAAPANASALLDGAMDARGYAPAGPVLRVPTGDGSTVSVQRGDGPDGPRLFLLLNDRYLGTDWVDASPLGVSDPVPVDTGSFAAAYGDGNGGAVTVTFTWTGRGFRPDRIAPGHCQTADRC